jgi:hypothetical protein
MSRLLDVSELLGNSPVRYERKPGDPESAAKQAESYASDERKRLLEGAAPSGLRAQVPQPTPTTLMPPKQQAPINLAPLKRPAAAKSPSLDISKNLPPAGSVGRDNGADDDNFAEYDPKSSSDFMDGIGKAFDTYGRMTGGVAKGVADAAVDSLPSWLRNANIPNLGAADNPYATDPLPPSVDKVGDALRGGAHFAADMATDPLTYVGGPAAKGSVAAIGGAIKGIGALAAKTGITKGMMAVLPSMFTRYVQRARMMPGGLPSELDAYLKKLQGFGNDTAKADAWANKTFSPKQQEVLMKQAEEFFGGLHGELKAAQGAKAAKPAPAPEVVKSVDDPGTAFRNKPMASENLEDVMRRDREIHAQQRAARAKQDAAAQDVGDGQSYRPEYARSSDGAQPQPVRPADDAYNITVGDAPGDAAKPRSQPQLSGDRYVRNEKPYSMNEQQRKQAADDLARRMESGGAEPPPGGTAPSASPQPAPESATPQGQIGFLRKHLTKVPFLWRTLGLPESVKRVVFNNIRPSAQVIDDWNQWASSLAKGIRVPDGRSGSKTISNWNDLKAHIVESGGSISDRGTDGLLAGGLASELPLETVAKNASKAAMPRVQPYNYGLTPAEQRIAAPATYPLRHPALAAATAATGYTADQLLNGGRISAALGVPSPSEIGDYVKRRFLGDKGEEQPIANGMFEVPRKPENDKRRDINPQDRLNQLKKFIADTRQRPGFDGNKDLQGEVKNAERRLEALEKDNNK